MAYRGASKKDLFYKPYFIFSTLLSSLIAFIFIFLMVTAAPTPEPNPALQASCGLDLVLALDLSDDLTEPDQTQMKESVKAFVDAFRGTPAQFALVFMGETAGLESPFTNDLIGLTGPTGAIDSLSSADETNWEDGLLESRRLLPHRVEVPDVLVVVTDGIPTVSTTKGNPLHDAIEQANLVKTDGGRVLGVTVGAYASVENLEMISSPDAIYDLSDFVAFAPILKRLSTETCSI